MIRVIEVGSTWGLVIGQVVVGYKQNQAEIEALAVSVRTWLERQLLNAYSRYAAELREQLHWRVGVGAAETMVQVRRLAVDLTEVRMDNLELQQKIAGLECETLTLKGRVAAGGQDLSRTTHELMASRDQVHEYRRVFREIASASSDVGSRMAAEGILYTKVV